MTRIYIKLILLLIIVLVAGKTSAQIYTEEVIDFESWEGGANDWTSGGTNNSWALGDPDGSVIDTAATGSQAWVTNLTGDYNNDEASWVMSPSYDFTGLTPAFVSFKLWGEMESNFDGLLLEVSTDGGTVWGPIGSSVTGTLWYNSNSIEALDSIGWTGSDEFGSGGWILAEHELPDSLDNKSDVRFRFYFASDNQETREGVGIDNFKLINGRTDHGTAYFEDFDNDDGGWAGDAEWNWTAPDPTHAINDDLSGGGKFWLIKEDGVESTSIFTSPTFNFAENSEQYFFNFGHFVNAEGWVDYSVEYTLDNSNWVMLGTDGNDNTVCGIPWDDFSQPPPSDDCWDYKTNWYWDSFQAPEGQGPINFNSFTDELNDKWIKSSISLQDYQGNDYSGSSFIKFRITYNNREEPTIGDSIAFDNILISKKNIFPEIINFSIPEVIGQEIISREDSLIEIYVNDVSSLSNIVASFELSSGATAKIGATPQVSGETINDFSDTLIYSVTSENGYFIKDWKVVAVTASKTIELSKSSAIPGDSIKIYGNYFDSLPENNNVTFGNVPAVVTAATENVLTVTVPDMAVGPTQVVVTNASGGSQNHTNFTVLDQQPNEPRTLEPYNLVKSIPGEYPGYHYQVEPIDLDNDGDFDIVYQTPEFVAWMSNDGAGNYTDEAVLQTYTEPAAWEDVSHILKAGDLNNDGRMDFVTTGFGMFDTPYGSSLLHKVHTYMNDGDGTFTVTESPYGGPDFTQRGALELADMNMDGYLDLLVGSPMQVSYNDGTGSFTYAAWNGNIDVPVDGTSVPYTLTLECTDVKAADYDGDGWMDIAVAVGDADRLWWLENNRDSTFTFHLIEQGINNPNRLFAYDHDKDGDLDLLVNVKNEEKIELFENLGDPNLLFKAVDDINLTSDFKTMPLAVGDFNQDGYEDIIADINYYSWFSHPLGEEKLLSEEFLPGFTPSDATLVDVDGDGDLDLFTFLGQSTFAYLLFHEHRYAGNDFQSFSVDGELSAAIIDTASATITVRVETGTDLTNIVPNFSLSYGAIATVSSVAQESGVTPNDFTGGLVYTVRADNDSTRDWTVNIKPWLAVTKIEPDHAIGGAQVLVYGTGFSTTPADNIVMIGEDQATVLASSENLLRIEIPSVNETNWGVHTLTVTTENGASLPYTNFTLIRSDQVDGTFLSHVIDANAESPRIATPADLDNDGDLDLIVGFGSQNEIVVYKNLEGNYVKEVIASNLQFDLENFSVGDIDRNGLLDIMPSVSNFGFKNLGDFEFESFSFEGTLYPKLADLNNNGYLDYGVGLIMSNDGAGNYPSFDEAYTQFNSSDWFIYNAGFEHPGVDLDADGDLDYILGSFNTSHYRELINDGSGNLSFGDTLPMVSGQYRGSADFDFDGHQEHIFVGGNTFEWYGDASTAYAERGVINDLNFTPELFADIDGNGTLDLMGLGNVNFRSALIKAFIDETFSTQDPEEAFFKNGMFDGIWTWRYGDLDNDGDLDILYALSESNEVGWLENVNTEKIFYSFDVENQTADAEVFTDSIVAYMPEYASLDSILPTFTLPPQAYANSEDKDSLFSGISKLKLSRNFEPITVNAEDGSTFIYDLKVFYIPDGLDNATPNTMAINSAKISFSDADPDAWTYEVEYADNDAFTNAQFITGDYSGTENISITELASGTQYWVRVRLVNGAGKSVADETSFWTLPDAPVLAEGIINRTDFDVNWPAVTGSAYYLVDVSTNNFLSFVPGYNDMVVYGTDTIVFGLNMGSGYQVRARAVNVADGQSSESATLSLETLPQIASWKNTSNITSTGFTLNWNESPGTDDYLLDISVDTFQTFIAGYDQQAVQDLLHSVTGLQPATHYQARLRSSNTGGIAPVSDTLMILTLPEIPDAVTFTNRTQTTVMAHWPKITGAVDYYLELSADEFSSKVSGYNPKIVSDTFLLIDKLSVGNDYQMVIRSRNATGQTINSEVFSFSTLPGTPTLSSSNITQNGFDLGWSSVSGSDAFKLDLSTNQFTTFVTDYQDKDLSETFHSLNGLSPATTYHVRIRSYNSHSESPYSDTLAILTVPATPTQVEFSERQQKSIMVSWDPIPGAEQYYLRVSNDEFSSFISGYGPKLVSDTFKLIDRLAIGTDYQLTLSTKNASGESPESIVFDFSTLLGSPSLDLSAVDQTNFTLEWNSINNADSFEIDLSTDNFSSYLSDYQAFKTAENFLEVSGLSPATQYMARIRSWNANGTSPESDTLVITTIPETPGMVAVSEIGQNEATLSWEAVDGNTNYYLDVSENNFGTFLRGFGPKILTDTSIIVNDLREGINYQVRLRSSNSSGQSPDSEEATFVTIPVEPLARDASSITDSSFRANWNSVSGATYYRLQISRDDFASLELDSTVQFALPLEVGNLKNDTLYKYRVLAGNENGASGFSNVIALFTLQGDVNNKPTDISLDNQTIAENQSVGNTVAALTTSDLDFEDMHRYSLVTGTGDEGNHAFEIVRNLLLTRKSFNFEDTSSYSIRIQTDDGQGETYEKSFIIDIRNVNDQPTKISLSDTSIEAYSAINTVVGVLQTEDEDHANHGYEVRNEAGLNAFTVFGNELRNTVVFTNEADSVIELVLVASDASGASLEDTFRILITPFIDVEPPVISQVTEPGEFVSGSSPISITADVTDFAIDEVTFLYKSLLADDYSSQLMDQNNTTYSVAVSEEMIGELGLQYYLVAVDESGNQSVTDIYSIPISFPQEESPVVEVDETRFGGEVSDYQILAIPYVFEGTDNRVSVIFDEYANDNYGTQWRLLRYSNNENALIDLTGSNEIQIGEGYFFNARTAREIKVGKAKVNLEDPFTLQLRAGWNLIGNPYNVDISWPEVLGNNPSEGVGPLRVLDPSNLSAWPESITLKKFAGAYVQSMEATTLSLSYTYNADGGRTTAEYDRPAYSWFVPITLQQNGLSGGGAIGMHRSAKHEADVLDRLTLPKWLQYLEMSFAHPEHPYGQLSEDIVKDTSYYVWNFEVAGSNAGMTRLTWEPNPSMINLKLLDLSNGELTDMLTASSYAFDLQGSNSFKLLYSENPEEQFIEHQIIVGDVYPNPSSGDVYLPVNLPAHPFAYEVNMSILDLSGRVNYAETIRLAPGQHDIRISEREFSNSGIYFVELSLPHENGQYHHRTKIIIQK
ncbi:MAG: VCBS repeat-containing protein [Cyclobacteriaceae bacterium]